MANLRPPIPIINWGNPLTKGLVFNIAPFEGSGDGTRDLTLGTVGSFQGAGGHPLWRKETSGISVRFDGTNQTNGGAIYFTQTAAQQSLSTISIEFMVYFLATTSNTATLLRSTDNTTSGLSYTLDTNGKVSFNASWTSGGAYTADTLTAAKDYHLVVTYDSTSTSNTPVFYTNGVKQTTTTVSGASGSYTFHDGQFVVGNANQTGNVGTRTFNGYVYKASVYNRILTETEVKRLSSDPWRIYKKVDPIRNRVLPFFRAGAV